MSPTSERKSIEVSVILPTYNRAAFLRAAVESVLSQSLRDLELIVVDDGSTDGTRETIGAFCDDRLVYVRTEENHGRSAARNLAIRLARGRYIAFIDSDDEYLPDKCEMQVAYLRMNPDVGMLYTSAICIDEAGNPLAGSYTAAASGSLYREIAFFVPLTITLPTVMIRKEILDTVGGFDPRLNRFEDTDLWRRVAKRYRIGALDVPTCRLRTHAGNALAMQCPKGIVDAIDGYVQKIFAEDGDHGVDFLKRGAAGLFAHYGLAMFRTRGQRGYGIRLIAKACVLSPMSMPVVVLGWGKAWLRSRTRRSTRGVK